MRASRQGVIAAIAWLGVGIAWYFLTRNAHPTALLAMIVTTSLIVAYASVSFVNQGILLPRYWQAKAFFSYWFRLLGLMLFANGLALAIIRFSYFRLHGPDLDPYGAYKHYGIDLFGMVVHVAAAAAIAKWLRRRSQRCA